MTTVFTVVKTIITLADVENDDDDITFDGFNHRDDIAAMVLFSCVFLTVTVSKY